MSKSKVLKVGFIGILLAIVGVYIVIFSDVSDEEDPTPEDPTPPVLKNLGVSFGPWDNDTNRAGDFIFLESENKVFLEFGAEVIGEGMVPKILSTFEYRIAPETNITAISNGIVVEIRFQDYTQDNEILLKPFKNSEWLIGLDHVKNLTISEGDTVEAGEIIGKPGTWSETLGRFEIMIYHIPSGKAYAPFKYFDSELSDEFQDKVWQFMADWEEFKNDTTIYDQDAMIYAGCLFEYIQET